MEKNQFFYTRKEANKQAEEDTSPITFTEYRDSFNVNKVIRSRSMEDGRVLILIDDIHERTQEVPDINVKTNKFMGYKRERNTYQSEIYLTKEDGERFYQLNKID